MSAVTVPPSDAPRLTPQSRPRSRSRKVKNVVANAVISLTFLVAMVPLVLSTPQGPGIRGPSDQVPVSGSNI